MRPRCHNHHTLHDVFTQSVHHAKLCFMHDSPLISMCLQVAKKLVVCVLSWEWCMAPWSSHHPMVLVLLRASNMSGGNVSFRMLQRMDALFNEIDENARF